MIGKSTEVQPHLWLPGSSHACREQVRQLGLTGVLAQIDADRRLRGPYTAAGSLLRRLAPEALEHHPELVSAHDIELPAVAPELTALVPGSRETLTSSASPQERTRYYPRARTTRLAHGVIEFVAELLQAQGRRGMTLVLENVDRADPTDAEWLTIMLRRMDPGLLRLVVCGEPKGLWGDLVTTLGRFAETVEVQPSAHPTVPEDERERARLYVGKDCTSSDPRLQEAYLNLPEASRRQLHDHRAAELEGAGERSLALGALAYHREHGSDPEGAGLAALRDAIEHCVLMGYYEAVVDLGRRCLALSSWDEDPEGCWLVVAKMGTAFGVLDQPDEAAAIYDEACAGSALPSIHLQAAYGRAMLYTRFFEPERRDHLKAKGWINTAIAISSLYPERQRRAYNLTFQENGLALIEMHLGDLAESKRLVTEGLDRLNRELEPDKEALHRSVLLYNQAQLLTRLGPPEEALRVYSQVIADDPNHSEYHFERAGLHRRMGNFQAAFDDYAEAMRLSPPYPEPYYNRGDLALELGHLEAALADFSYVIELDPSFAAAYVNRAGILFELGDLDAAEADVTIGLALDPEQAALHCTRGLIAQERGDASAARKAFDEALAVDPSLAAALSNRAVLAFDAGDVEGSIADFGRALEIADDPQVRSNRAFAYFSAGRWDEAIADYGRLAEAGGPEQAEALYRRGLCLSRRGDDELARADFRRCLECGDDEYGPLALQELEAEPELEAAGR